MGRQSVRTERLEARVTSGQKALFQQAASVTGRTLTDFVVSSVNAAAIQAIQGSDLVKLSVRDRAVFVSALLKPPRPSKKLRAAARRYKKRATTSSGS